MSRNSESDVDFPMGPCSLEILSGKEMRGFCERVRDYCLKCYLTFTKSGPEVRI